MKKKETEFLTEEEAQAMLRVSDRRTLQGKRDYAILLTLLTTGLRKAEVCSLKVGDLKTYRNQAVIDVIGKGQKFRRIPLDTKPLIAIQGYLKASGNGTGPDHPIFNTLEKHEPYQERGLTHKAVDCFIQSMVKRALIQKRVHPQVGYNLLEEDLNDAARRGQGFQIFGGHQLSRGSDGQIGSQITYLLDAGPLDAIHESILALDEQGGLPGWTGDPEQRATHLE
jgi:integrase